MAQSFLQLGMRVVIVGFNPDYLREAQQTLGGSKDVQVVQADVGDRDQLRHTVDQAVRAFGKIHVLRNNAGIGGGGDAEKLDFDGWDRALRVNLGGVVNGVKIVTPLILSHGEGGHILNASSLAGSIRSGFNNICVHKGLVNSKEPRPEIGHPADLPKAARCRISISLPITRASSPPSSCTTHTRRSRQVNCARACRTSAGRLNTPLLCRDLKNTYAELGTTWASSIVTFPTLAAHIMGQMLKFMGPDRILFGSDSVWYGSPQWQIDAMWRFQIPEGMRRKWLP